MGFTVEDMLLVSEKRYHMQLIAGKRGWSNSISWLLMLEDVTIVQRFSGKEIAVTTGLGFPTEEKLRQLCVELVRQQASGLIINTGCYIQEVPAGIRKFADDNSLPLLTVPWDVEIAEMIKDLSIRVFLQGSTDEQISAAFIRAIESPGDYETYSRVLLPHFDVDGLFQAVVLMRENLADMDTVERRRLGYRLQLALTNLTHNGHFFYYDGCFIVIMNALKPVLTERIIRDFHENMRQRIPHHSFVIGVGSPLSDIRNLHVSFARAKAAVRLAPVLTEKPDLVFFDSCGPYRLLSRVTDPALLKQVQEEYLQPLIDYDEEHGSGYVATLENYLRYGGSIQKVAEVMFIHRNTISYRMNHIRELTGCSLSSEEDRLNYLCACMICRMRSSR